MNLKIINYMAAFWAVFTLILGAEFQPLNSTWFIGP
jgi:hypothetical protein